MSSQNTMQQKDWVPIRKLFLKKLKATKKSIGSLGIKNITLWFLLYIIFILYIFIIYIFIYIFIYFIYIIILLYKKTQNIMRSVIVRDHSDSLNAKRMNKPGWTRILQSLPCTTGCRGNQGQVLFPRMRLIPLMKSLKQAEEIWLPPLIHGENVLSTRTDLPLCRCFNWSQPDVYPCLCWPDQKWPFL